MRIPQAFSSTPQAALACLTAALLTLGCTQQENPTLPSSGGRGGTSSTVRIDGSVAGEAGQMPSDAQPESSTAEEVASDAFVGAACDLLQQDCPSSPMRHGCYPVAGAGRCHVAGELTSLVTCAADTDCMPGLVCNLSAGAGSFGLCEPLCDLKDATSATCVSQVCARRADLPEGVGSCRSS